MSMYSNEINTDFFVWKIYYFIMFPSFWIDLE